MSHWNFAARVLAFVSMALFAGCSETTVAAKDTPDTAAETPAAPDTAVADAVAAPEAVALSTVDEKEIAALIKAAEGKVLVLNFWATWCPPCVAEMPEFVKFYEKMDKDTTAFISLSADDPESYEKVVGGFREDHDMDFPVHVLNTRVPDALYGALRTQVSGALPTTIIYNKMGKVVHVWERDTTYDELAGAVKTLL